MKEEDEENELLDCPNCGREYDDIDVDFLICHHCGHNAVTGKTDRRKASVGRAGIDPDATSLNEW